MDKDQVKGKVKEATGAGREKAGEMTGDEEMEARGEAEKHEGKAQGAFGKLKEKTEQLKERITGD